MTDFPPDCFFALFQANLKMTIVAMIESSVLITLFSSCFYCKYRYYF